MGNFLGSGQQSVEDCEDPKIHGVSYLPNVKGKSWIRYGSKKTSDASSTKDHLKRTNENHNHDNSYLVGETKCNGTDNGVPTSTICAQQQDDINPDDLGIDSELACPNDWLKYRQYPFENIVFSGGGSKGYSFVGALKALEDCGVLNQVKRVAGSSAGAICGGLLAVGCSPQEIADVFKCDIKWLFQDQTCALCCGLPRMCRKYGVHPGKRFNKIYGEHISRKVGNPDITFKQLYEDHGRELCIVVTNLTRMCSEYCHPKTTPDLPIRVAVRMSMSFPLVYRAVRYELHGRKSLYTDGGMLDQYPIHCFDGSALDMNDNTEQPEEDDQFADLKFNDKSLGLYVISEKPIDYKIWHSLFQKDIPYKATYLPNTKLARARLKDEVRLRKRKSEIFDKKEYLQELQSNHLTTDSIDKLAASHYETLNKSQVDIRSFGDYFVTAIETLLVSQRKLHIREEDYWRTVAINCGYIGTNDYTIEPGDREFMIRQGYAHTRRYLMDYLEHRTHGTNQPHLRPTLRRTQTVPNHISELQTTLKRTQTVPNNISEPQKFLRRTHSTLETQV